MDSYQAGKVLMSQDQYSKYNTKQYYNMLMVLKLIINNLPTNWRNSLRDLFGRSSTKQTTVWEM